MVGLIRKLSPRWLYVFGLVAAAFVAAVSAPSANRARAECVFPLTPTTYEDMKDRRLFLDTIDLAAFNLLFPGDKYFGVPSLKAGPRTNRFEEVGKVPPTLLKAVGWIESSITQAAVDVPFGSIGPALVSFDCGLGVSQVTTGVTSPLGENGRATPEQALVTTHFAYNIARGAAILADKWNKAPEERPIAGIDTNGTPLLIENWYFAVWSYNGFTGPGSNRSNHPLDPIYGSWPRPAYSCGTTGDGKGHNRANYPYQELVFGCISHPPVVEGVQLWKPIPVSLPDLNNPAWREPLLLQNFVFPYVKMDMPTPQPFHLDDTPQPNPALRQRVLGTPEMKLSASQIKIGYTPGAGSSVETVEITNIGTGVLSWYAIATEPWIILKPYTGIAAGPDLRCELGKPCERSGRLEVTVDASKAPPGRRTAAIRIQALGTNQATVIGVEVSQVMRLGVPGVSRN